MPLRRRAWLVLGVALGLAANVAADPQSDLTAMREFYAKRFFDIPVEAHKDGAYALDAGSREQWLELEDFPPYEIDVDAGAELFSTPFADGEDFSACFEDGAVRQNYPYFDGERSTVVTLEMAVNACRVAHGEDEWPYDSTEMAALVGYIAYESRGATVNLAVPASPAELAAYNAGKQYYQSRRGQLNFACSSCHVQMVGNKLRAETLSASVGHVTHWPTYRFKWQALGPLHLRFQECNSQVGAEPLALQSETYRNLEYFLTFMANGLEWNGPSTRK
jgi:sulfur-oxidizing protein SoxA